MRDLKKNYTKEEAAAFVESLRQVSEFVRILSKDEIEGKHPLTADFKQSYCYRALKKDSPCENCISKIVMENKSDSTKIEFINEQCYQFFARYIIVEGVECSIEIAVKINEKELVDSIGYKELVSYIRGEMSLNEAIEKIKQHSRNYAKRQLTWFRRNDKIIWINPNDKDILNKILALYNKQC